MHRDVSGMSGTLQHKNARLEQPAAVSEPTEHKIPVLLHIITNNDTSLVYLGVIPYPVTLLSVSIKVSLRKREASDLDSF